MAEANAAFYVASLFFSQARLSPSPPSPNLCVHAVARAPSTLPFLVAARRHRLPHARHLSHAALRGLASPLPRTSRATRSACAQAIAPPASRMCAPPRAWQSTLRCGARPSCQAPRRSSLSRTSPSHSSPSPLEPRPLKPKQLEPGCSCSSRPCPSRPWRGRSDRAVGRAPSLPTTPSTSTPSHGTQVASRVGDAPY